MRALICLITQTRELYWRISARGFESTAQTERSEVHSKMTEGRYFNNKVPNLFSKCHNHGHRKLQMRNYNWETTRRILTLNKTEGKESWKKKKSIFYVKASPFRNVNLKLPENLTCGIIRDSAHSLVDFSYWRSELTSSCNNEKDNLH